MSNAGVVSESVPEPMVKILRACLFPDTEALNTFMVLDGASIPDLLDHLYGEIRPEFVCLYRGELEPDIAAVAPYLVRLQAAHPFAEWILTQGWGKHWGIFALAQAGLKVVRTHFRKFLMIKHPDGNQLYFRFYDPRVLHIFLPTCNAEELGFVFGPLNTYVCECEPPDQAATFQLQDDQLRTRFVSSNSVATKRIETS